LAAVLVAGTSGAAVTKLRAPLKGSDTTDTDGRGRAIVRLDPQARTVCFNVRWRNLDDQPFAAHIHVGGEGVDGPILVPFFDAASPEEALPDQIAGVNGCARDVPRSDIRAIKDDPAGHYVNVHTESFPGGAIRGQLKKA
ncbi:MAG: CHRD domain-containing protein, partial [Actinomycetota bacterium]